MKVLFIGDVFGDSGIVKVKNVLPDVIKKHDVDFVILQAENVSGRKGLLPKHYMELKSCGVDAFVLGNHVWAKREISKIINNDDIIRPYNVSSEQRGKGSRVFEVNGKTLRVTEMLGITFNSLNQNWNQDYANNFFDAADEIIENDESDFHIIDLHGEVTSEKNVFGIYLDGKVSALVGTHTHVQTSDAKILEKGTAYITDVGMVGPKYSAIGASFDSVYKKMRYDEMVRFEASKNDSFFNSVLITIDDNKNKIEYVNID